MSKQVKCLNYKWMSDICVPNTWKHKHFIAYCTKTFIYTETCLSKSFCIFTHIWCKLTVNWRTELKTQLASLRPCSSCQKKSLETRMSNICMVHNSTLQRPNVTCFQDSQVLYNLVQKWVPHPVHFLEFGSNHNWCSGQVPSQQLSFQSENKKSILVLGQTIRVNHYVMRHMVSNVQKLKSSNLQLYVWNISS